MFAWASGFFSRNEESTDVVPTLGKLEETLEALEGKERQFLKRIDEEIAAAKNFSNQKNKRAAINCLKRKKMLEAQVESINAYQLRIHDQIILLESAKVTAETFSAIRSGVDSVKGMQKTMGEFEKVMDDLDEQTENLKQVQEAIKQYNDFDEDELTEELDELESTLLKEDLDSLPTSQQEPAKAPAATTSSTSTTSKQEEAAKQKVPQPA